MDDTKTPDPDGEAQLAKDMTAAEFQIAKALASRNEAARQQKASDEAALARVAGRFAKKDAAP